MSSSELELRRLEITEGYAMPGFKGRYFMWPEEYWLLSKYLDMTQGAYLEIGSMCGIIAMSFAEKYPHRHFVCVDKFSAGHGTIAGEKRTFLRNQREHNLRNVTLVEGDSLTVVPELAGNFDIVFVDGNHSYDYVLGDAINSWRLLLPGGFIAFHDYGYVEETTRAVEEVLRQTGGRFVESSSSLAVVQKQESAVRAGLRSYMQSQYERALEENNGLKQRLEVLEDSQNQYARALEENNDLKQRLEVLERDTGWLLSSIETHEEAVMRMIAEKRELGAVWEKVQVSAGWRMLNVWRRLRNRVAAEGSWPRRVYDAVLRPLRGRSSRLGS